MALVRLDQDHIDGSVAELLREAAKFPNWNSRKRELVSESVAQAKRLGYISFTGDFRTYGIEHKGEQAVFEVLQGQRGALAPFAGQIVHLICLGKSDQRAGRHFLAGSVATGNGHAKGC